MVVVDRTQSNRSRNLTRTGDSVEERLNIAKLGTKESSVTSSAKLVDTK